jgi:hypothetical protein
MQLIDKENVIALLVMFLCVTDWAEAYLEI